MIVASGRLPFVDRLISLALFAATVAALGYAQKDMGVMRDEGTYFHAAERYVGWLEQLPDRPFARSIDRHVLQGTWSDNSEHPVLMKVLFGISWRVLHKCECTKRGSHFHPVSHNQSHLTLGLLSEISAFRLPGWLMTGLAVMLLYLFGVRYESRVAGLSAALLFATIPRVFFHGQLACFDAAVTTCGVLVVYGYVRSLDKLRWGVLTGIFFGVALAAKHNAWFIPALLLIHYLIVVWPDLSLRPLQLPRVAPAFLCMAILGPLVFFAHWPWLWFDTIRHLEGYFAFHLRHSFYNFEYLGTNWGPPPLPVSFPFGMSLFTLPTIMLVLALFGWLAYSWRSVDGVLMRNHFTRRVLARLGFTPGVVVDNFRYPAHRTWRRPGRGLDPRLGTLLVINALFPLLLIALPTTPIFGGTKHFMPAFPFMALLAGVGVSRIYGVLRDRGFVTRALGAAMVVLVALPGALNTAFTQPYGLSQYNALAGGVAGGADLGLNRQFWGYAVRPLLPWMNDKLPDNANVYFHDVNHAAYGSYVRDGLLRSDIQYAGMERPAIKQSDHAIVIHELHFNKYDYWIWDAYGSPTPTRVLTLDGVPLVSVYARKPGKTR